MSVAQARCDVLECAYLEHIRICILSGDRNVALWRQLLDPWYAYRRGPEFVKRTEAPVTFNPKEQATYQHVIRLFPFHSVEAHRVLRGETSGALTKEHAVPVAVIRDCLAPKGGGAPYGETIDEIRLFLDQNYVVGMVTVSEHERLKPFNSRMPLGWKPATDLFARYRNAEPPILLEDSDRNPL